jgi:hypothetical protein
MWGGIVNDVGSPGESWQRQQAAVEDILNDDGGARGELQGRAARQQGRYRCYTSTGLLPVVQIPVQMLLPGTDTGMDATFSGCRQ